MIQATQKRNVGFSIGVTCPGCGAEIELEDNFFVLECRHCGSVLRILMPEAPPAYVIRPARDRQAIRFLLDRYCREQSRLLIPSRAVTQLTYYPYWKIDAITLKVRSTTYEVDLSNQENPDDDHTEERETTTINLAPFAATNPAGPFPDGVPHTLGLRTNYIRMVPFIEGAISAEANCVPVTSQFSDAVRLATSGLTSIGRIDQAGSLRHETKLFHPVGSIVYFPYFVTDSYAAGAQRRYISDGVTGKVVSSEELDDAADEVGERPPTVAFGSLQVELHRCTNCGVDLPMTRSSVHQCHNCQRVEFFLTHPALDRQILVTGKRAHTDTLFPFWSIRTLNKSAQAMFGGIHKTDRVVIPAFELRNLEAAYRLAKRMTTASGNMPLRQIDAIDQQHIPVTRSVSESLALLEVLWHREVAERDSGRGQSYAAPELRAISLFFAPFHPEHYFFIDSVLQAVTFEKSAYYPPVK